MCVLAWAWRAHPDYPLVVLANRDELYDRPTAPLGWWAEVPTIAAGRDLEAGGTWLGVSRGGRFAALSNRGGPKPARAPSRGGLVAGFLKSDESAAVAAATIQARADRYAGFNLLLGDGHDLVYVSNREPERLLTPGIYGMANGGFDEVSPRGKRLVGYLSGWVRERGLPEPQTWFTLLADTTRVQAGDPLSALFVRADVYGTRASQLVWFGSDGRVSIREHRFDARGRIEGEQMLEFDLCR